MAHQGQGYTYIPPQERTWQRVIDLQLRSQLRDECKQWSHVRGTQAPSSSSLSTTWWNSQHWESPQLWREWQMSLNWESLNFVRLVDRIHEIHVIEWETSSRVFVVGVALDKDPSNNQTRLFVTWDLDWHVGSSQKPRKARMRYREDKSSTMLENWQGYTSSIQKTKNLKNLCGVIFVISRKSRFQTLPCRFVSTVSRSSSLAFLSPSCRAAAVPKEFRVSFLLRFEREREFDSLTHYNVVHKFVPVLQAMKILDAKAAVNKEWRSSRKFLRGRWIKWRAKRMLFLKHKKRKRKSTLLHWWTFVISRIAKKNKSTKNTKDESCSEETVKDDSDAHAVFTEQGSSASQMTLQKPWMLLRDYQDVLDKPLTQYQLTPR